MYTDFGRKACYVHRFHFEKASWVILFTLLPCSTNTTIVLDPKEPMMFAK